MEADQARAASTFGAEHTVGDVISANDMTTTTNSRGSVIATSSSTDDASEDVLLFGARSSHLFDNISVAIDSLLTEEVATLPLLPRKLTDYDLQRTQQQQQQQQLNEGSTRNNAPQTGEQKLIAHLRKTYQKNIDAAEEYCNRNIFTIQHHSKTKRRQILEQYFNKEKVNPKNNENAPDSKNSAGESITSLLPSDYSTAAMAFAPLPEGMELPSPDHIIQMDKEILETRQRIQDEKRRRIQQSRQLSKLAKANELLMGVLEAINMIQELEENYNHDDNTKSVANGAAEIATLMQSLKQSILNAMDGHEELKIWNARAEEVLQLLDTIKIDREEIRERGRSHNPNNSHGSASGHGAKMVVEREEDERRRKNTLQEMGASHGTKEQVATLLNKLRGN